MPEGTLKPDEVANLDPYKIRQGRAASKAEELLTGVEPIPETQEDSDEIQRFSDEARKALEKEGYIIYELTGQTLKSLRESERKFWRDWTKDYDLDTLPSRLSEVAINPEKLFIPRSESKTFDEQLEMVKKYSDGLNIPGVEAILGEAPDYTELAFTHLDKTGQRLFGKVYQYGYTRTQTRVGSDIAIVGEFDAADGFNVDFWHPDRRYGNLHAAPLVVPTGTK